MPFVSRAQARACWAADSAARKAGKTPTWDCHEWASESPTWSKLPEASKGSKRARSRSKSPAAGQKKKRTRPASKTTKPKIQVGPRGGKYFMSNGRKIYVK